MNFIHLPVGLADISRDSVGLFMVHSLPVIGHLQERLLAIYGASQRLCRGRRICYSQIDFILNANYYHSPLAVRHGVEIQFELDPEARRPSVVARFSDEFQI
ncbi:MAG: hypothetical protein AAF353_18825 [Pseudomonadota bacterium]